MLRKIRIKPLLLVVALLTCLAAFWSYAIYSSKRLSPQEQMLVGTWTYPTGQRILHFHQDRTSTSTWHPTGGKSSTTQSRWFIADGVLVIREDSKSLFQSQPEEPFPIYRLTSTTLQLGTPSNLMPPFTRMPP
jgi:hypothetical protein